MTYKYLDSKNIFRNLSQQDFLSFGMQELAYIRPIKVENGAIEYAIHAADGTPLSIMETMDMALVVTRHNELEPLTVH